MLPGMDVEDTYLRLKEVVEALISYNTLPIIIGGSHDLDYGQFLAYEHLEKAINMVTIDSCMDMAEAEDAAANQKHLLRILMHEPNYLFSFSQIGHQSYLVEPEMIGLLEKLHFDTYRIGEVHRAVQEMEPVVRQADMVSFDISAIRFQDAPAYAPANPFGLTGEEACQLCWYAGTNDNLTSFGVYEYDPTIDTNNLASMTIATMIWYFIEGYYHRKNEIDFSSKSFVKYAIGFHDNPDKMVFYKSKTSEKWWLEVEPLSDGKASRIIPCSYEDYLTATNGEVPNRWILTQQRMG
ncbi:MAG: formimidoylglutamase [Hymenobacteraceae bacterium]|nr:formimidoylglutamase [Hymenobacteraceae bacterium]MDX5396334.1 formimidoylglutamase [Hymenobacteraceae bacterium]MDX5512394.1 formimidoylglutamase [Hymenobacteraceae bacterium]